MGEVFATSNLGSPPVAWPLNCETPRGFPPVETLLPSQGRRCRRRMRGSNIRRQQPVLPGLPFALPMSMADNGRPKSEVVVITGASAGVGRALAQAFARRGARIGLIARGPDGLEATRLEVEELGGQALVLPLDVADAAALESAAASMEARFGPIDIWINNAMLSVFSPVMEMEPDEFKRVTEVTYLGYVYGTLAALRRMKTRDRGIIVHVGSALAYRGIPLQSAYCAAKHAVQGFHDSLRSELIHDGSKVRTVMVQLPAVNTPQFRWVKSRLPRKSQPVPPIFQPEAIADAIIWSAYNGPREVNVGWPAVKAIWGNNFFPQLGDWYLAKNGYDAQMIDEPEDKGRRDNLWEPVPGDHGAHGVFDDIASNVSLEFELRKRRGWIAAAGALCVTGLLVGRALARPSGRRRRKQAPGV